MFKKRSEKYRKFTAVIIILIALVIIFIKFLFIKTSHTDNIDLSVYNCNNNSETYSEIYIQIDGAINNPGVYKVKSGSFLVDIIKEANGLDKNADIVKIDLTQQIEEDTKIFIPFIFKSNLTNTNKININNANLTALIKINGIGKTYAQNIIKFRAKKRINSIKDLMQIKGIGKKRAEKIITQISF